MSATEHLPEAISAASLVLAVLAALYTLWLPAVSSALIITPADDKEDRGPQRTEVVTVLFTKALPLAGATLAATLILLPRGIAIVAETCMRWREWAFDDVKGLFVLTLSLMLLLALVSSVQLIGLLTKLKEIGPKP